MFKKKDLSTLLREAKEKNKGLPDYKPYAKELHKISSGQLNDNEYDAEKPMYIGTRDTLEELRIQRDIKKEREEAAKRREEEAAKRRERESAEATEAAHADTDETYSSEELEKFSRLASMGGKRRKSRKSKKSKKSRKSKKYRK